MGFINLAEKTINAKLVYYGCGMGGKTTSLQVVHETMCPRNEVELVSIKTEEDATLLFDFLPLDLGNVEGFKVRIQGYTVPGQPKYKRMRKYVLSGADAVVFVVDSEASRLEENVQSLRGLLDNLKANNLDPETIPIVVQYNKRDLEDILSEEELDRHFRIRDDVATFPSVATEGRGVFEAFTHAAGMLVEQKVRLYRLGRGKVDAAVVAEGARRKLWEIHDAAAEERIPARRDTVELTFDDEGRRSGGPPVEPQRAEEAVFDEADFDFPDLAPEATEPRDAAETWPAPPDDAEPLPALLDATFASNVEMVERYARLERYKNQLEEKNRELVQVTQNVVHDLKRPLSAVRLMLSSLQRGYAGPIPEQALKAIDNGLAAAHAMDRLIHDILDSSRLDFDGVRLDFRKVDLGELVAQIVDQMRYELEEHAVTVNVGPLPTISCDEWAITRAMTNLLGNAVQYRHPDRQARVRVTAERDDDRWLLRVVDNGIGIPAADLPRLFQRFERGSNTGGISGTGLGLHIIREIALGHGGDVLVESAEGQGTTFVLVLPMQPVQPPHSQVSDLDPSLAPQGSTAPALAEDEGEIEGEAEGEIEDEIEGEIGVEVEAETPGSLAGRPPRVFGRPDLG